MYNLSTKVPRNIMRKVEITMLSIVRKELGIPEARFQDNYEYKAYLHSMLEKTGMEFKRSQTITEVQNIVISLLRINKTNYF